MVASFMQERVVLLRVAELIENVAEEKIDHVVIRSCFSVFIETVLV